MVGVNNHVLPQWYGRVAEWCLTQTKHEMCKWNKPVWTASVSSDK
jgi:hypothetical protein